MTLGNSDLMSCTKAKAVEFEEFAVCLNLPPV